MEIVKISAIKANSKNPRVIKDDKFKKLVQSIREFPDMLNKRPLICFTDVDKKYVVLGGNMRLKAAQEIGLKEMPIILADDWTQEQKDEFLIKDNVGFGEWDWDQLANEWDAELLDKWGLDIPNFDKEVLEAEEDDFDTTPPEISITVLGDLYEIGDHRLLCGDSTDSDQVAKLMNGEKANMVFTDPPYGVNVVSGNGNIGGNTKNAKAGNYSKVIGDDKPYNPSHLFLFDCFIFIWGANYFIDKLPSRGQWVVWDKNRPQGTTFSDCELAWTNGKGIAIKKYKCTWDGFHREGESEKRVHPTQKPIKLCSDILKNFTNNNEIIIDLFLGSGSTMVASHQIKRKCYGMELDPKYCDVIVNRMIALDPDIRIKLNGKPFEKAY